MLTLFYIVHNIECLEKDINDRFSMKNIANWYKNSQSESVSMKENKTAKKEGIRTYWVIVAVLLYILFNLTWIVIF